MPEVGGPEYVQSVSVLRKVRASMATSAAGMKQDTKSAPDLSKLAGMTARVVQVTKHLSKQGAGQLVVPAWKNVSTDQITSLQTELPAKFGAGTYKFEVYDEGGPEKDSWIVRLGPEAQEMPEVHMDHSGGNGGNGGGNFGGAPAAVRNLGNGYSYDAELGLLITPDKRAIQWRPGEELPGATPRPAAAASTPPWASWATPASTPPWASLGWGNIPVDRSSDDDKVKALEARLRETELRNEQRQAEAERRRETEQMLARLEQQRVEDNKRFEMLLAKLSESAKPVGPDPQVEILKASMEQMRLQHEATSRESEARLRETETRRREDQLRAEMKAMQDATTMALREATANKADPMIPLLTTMMNQQQMAALESVKAIRDQSLAQAAAAERTAIGPLQLVDLMKKSDEGATAINKSMVEMFQNLMGMAQGLVREQAEMHSGSGGPAWLPIAQEGVQTLGRVAAMYAQAKAGAEQKASIAERQAQVAAERQQRAIIQQQQQQQLSAARQRQQQQPAPAPQAAPVAPSVSLRDAAAARVFTRPVSPAQSARDAAADAIFGKREDLAAQSTVAAEATAQAARAGHGLAPGVGANSVAPTVATVPVSPGVAPQKRRRRNAANVPAPEQAAPATVVAAGATILPDGSIVPVSAPVPVPIMPDAILMPQPDYTGEADEEIDDGADGTEEEFDVEAANAAAAAAAPDELRAIVNTMSDDEFFGPALPDVLELRETLRTKPETLHPEGIATWILHARQQLLAFGITPPAAEMLDLGHVEILVERLFPGIPGQAHDIISQNVRKLMQAHEG